MERIFHFRFFNEGASVRARNFSNGYLIKNVPGNQLDKEREFRQQMFVPLLSLQATGLSGSLTQINIWLE